VLSNYEEQNENDQKREAKTSVTIGVRCHGPLLAMLDDYRRSEPDLPTRASALRRLAIIGLKDKSRLTTSFRGAGINAAHAR
jgi:hypothetical protein